MKPEDVLKLIFEVRDDLQREEDQGLLQHDLHKAEQALAGKYACDRIARAVKGRCAMVRVDEANAGRKR